MDTSQTRRGFAYGVAATIVMSTAMALGSLSGVSPLPEPVPRAVVTSLLGVEGPLPVVAALAVGLHLAYGGLFGALLAAAGRQMTLPKGLGLGVVLWVAMGLLLMPALGWGAFGTAVTPRVAVATLALHLVYGGALGWTLGRDGATASPRGTATVD